MTKKLIPKQRSESSLKKAVRFLRFKGRLIRRTIWLFEKKVSIKFRARKLSKNYHFRDCSQLNHNSIDNGVVVSILIPSRERPKELCNVLKNISETLKEPSNVEVLVRLDEDDKLSLKKQEEFFKAAGLVNLRILVGPRKRGYYDLHIFVNELASVSKGDFLLLFNDDSIFTSIAWDIELLKRRNELAVFNTSTPENLQRNIFPVVHRHIFEIIGHFAQSPFNDAYIQEVAEFAGIHQDLPTIEIKHLRDQMTDQTFIETNALQGACTEHFNSISSVNQRIQDATLLVCYITKFGNTITIPKASVTYYHQEKG